MEKRSNFFDLSQKDLQERMKVSGKEKFRAEQLFRWVYQKKVIDPQQMTNFSKDFRIEVAETLRFDRPAIVQDLKSVDGTRKFLFDITLPEAIGPRKTVEAVLIPSDGRLTLCVSSEVGCNMGCRFCYTGKQKLTQRLSASDIVGQFLGATERIENDPVLFVQEGQTQTLSRITNIVFMGMGEPLDNPDAVFKSVEILNSPWGMNFSRRKVTVSTSGLVDKIPLIAQAKVRLAVSLNATTDAIRDEVMPINKAFPLDQLLNACRAYTQLTKDRVTFEYVLLKGVTDSLEDAHRLRRITRDIPCKINLIPFNEHPGADYQRPSIETVHAFQKECMRLGMHVLLRKTMGRDIYAACGQLRSKFEGHPGRMDNFKVAPVESRM